MNDHSRLEAVLLACLEDGKSSVKELLSNNGGLRKHEDTYVERTLHDMVDKHWLTSHGQRPFKFAITAKGKKQLQRYAKAEMDRILAPVATLHITITSNRRNMSHEEVSAWAAHYKPMLMAARQDGDMQEWRISNEVPLGGGSFG